MDYNETINLPVTEFSMRANLPQKEPDFIERWQRDKIYEKQLEMNKNCPKFILHDGPPYANGDIHLGTALNKCLKDIIVKYYSMNGYYVPYIPGWDTHGLPIELRAIKEKKLRKDEVGIVAFRDACRDLALKYQKIQAASFERLGVRADWDKPYLTLKPEFEAEQIRIFGAMADKGYIYKGLKPVYWCPICGTALAEAEIEYQEDDSDSIFVKFPVADDKGVISGVIGKDKKVSFLIWTTTAWTLPGNLAISLNPDFVYDFVSVKDEVLVIAHELLNGVMKAANVEDYKVLGSLKGKQLEYVTCKHPFLDRTSLVIVGNHVTLDAGTGCVHTAPGFGIDDYNVCRNYKEIGIVVPVNGKGVQTEEAGIFAGQFYEKSSPVIVEWLKDNGYLFATMHIKHQYPHCWRCKEPVIMRATEQWFVSIDAFRDKALKEIAKVKWLPDWGENRLSKMVVDRSDWCISRQRSWGVPIPIVYCKTCGKPLINKEVFESIAKCFETDGSNAWYTKTVDELLRYVDDAHKTCGCGGKVFDKETDIMDVWFDSGSSYAAVFKSRKDVMGNPPADLYLEGSDQFRGWFQSSLLTSVAVFDKAPYKQVVSHGYVVDGQGRKMSKSLGNGIDPNDVVKEYGADILRLWVAASDYTGDIRVSKDIFKQISEMYRKIRNTARFILGNLNGFNPDTDSVVYKDMLDIDKWALGRLNQLVKFVHEKFKSYEFHAIVHELYNFCVVDMSNNYLDIIKDRLYTSRETSVKRRSAQTAMFTIIDALVKIVTPILPFTSEEIWDYMPHKSSDNKLSVQLNSFPKYNAKYDDAEIDKRWEKTAAIKADVAKALEEARNAKLIGNSLQAKVTLYADGETYDFIKANSEDIMTACIVSGLAVEKTDNAPIDALNGENVQGLKVFVSVADGEKCERCWMYSTTVGQSSEHPTLCARCRAEISK